MAKFTKTVTETVNCPRCTSEAVVKRGKSRDGTQTYACKVCKGRLYNDGLGKGRRVPPEQIGAAINLFYDGPSIKAIAENLSDLFDIPEPSKASVYEWVRDYTGLAQREMEKYKAKTGSEWVADEMVLKVGGEKYWNWNVMDADTRYILASHLSKRRDMREAMKVMEKAKANAANLPKTIKTDRLKSYIDAIERVFGADVKHIQSDGITAPINNNLSERLQGAFRQRTKVMRGLQSLETGQHFLDGWVINYNLFRPHESLGGRTPAQLAQVDAPFSEWSDFAKFDASEFSSKRRRAERQRREFRERGLTTSSSRNGFRQRREF